MRQSRLALACAALVCSACGGRADGQQPAPRRDGGIAAIDAAPIDVAERPLGLPDLAAFLWRRRGGHLAYQAARKAEATAQWEEVVTTCRQALAADPGHLEAAWLLAAALGRLGRTDEILEPLHAAVAGDFGKWGHASLEHPALAAFLAAPVGKAWARRAEQDRAAYTAALARSLIVTAGGELYAYDPRGPRWHRLTHTYGAVIGGLLIPAEKRLIYVARQRVRGKKEITLAVGVVDLARGRALGAVELGTKGPISVAYSAKKSPGVWIGARGPRGVAWQVLAASGKLEPLPPKTARPPGPTLEVAGRWARPRSIPVEDVTADFDDKGLASAIRIGRSNRILSIPSPGLIDGNSLRWSADRAQLAFVAQLDDECGQGAPNAAAYVADAMTGALRELERATAGITVDWLSDGRPVVAGDKGVAIHDLGGGAPAKIDGADGLLAPRVRPKCTAPAPDDDAAPPAPDEPELPEPAGAAGDGAAGAAGAAGGVTPVPPATKPPATGAAPAAGAPTASAPPVRAGSPVAPIAPPSPASAPPVRAGSPVAPIAPPSPAPPAAPRPGAAVAPPPASPPPPTAPRKP